jgi:urea transport system ATP-binding protein
VPERIFELFPVLKQMLRRRGGDLSGGQQQQLAIGARAGHEAEAAHPRRADRGHPALDHQGYRARHPHFLAEQATMAILLVEQYYDFARSLADRYVVMERGEIVHARVGERPWKRTA